MSIEEIQSEIADLSVDDLSRIIAQAVHLKRLQDPGERKVIQDRLNDTQPENWLSVEDFAAKLDEN